MNFNGKNVTVLGLGASGRSAAELLRAHGAHVTVRDSAPENRLAEQAAALRARGIAVLTGEEAENSALDCEYAILSPGIDPAVPLVRRVAETGVPILGELELGYLFARSTVVAITGTNGKTTTTSLLTHILNACGRTAVACGNIGLPITEAVRQEPPCDVLVTEVSSFQLETIQSFRPKVAVWMNFSANHLDRYRDVEEYRQAKLRIFENQTAEDFAVANARDALPALKASVVRFDAQQPGADFSLSYNGVIHFRGEPVADMGTMRLSGIHNAENLMAALGVGYCLGLDFAVMAQAAKDYSSPEHRCEFVAEINGVRWINDSKSTNLDALEKALLSQHHPVILIAGGKDKGFEYDDVAGLVSRRVRHAVLIGQMRYRIATSWKDVPCQVVDSLEDAVAAAAEIARPGETVLFSPGTSSFDMFRSYEERGRRFKALVAQHDFQNQATKNTP